MGRPSKITEVQPAVITAVQGGASLSGAAALAGVTYRTLRNWINRGEAELARINPTPEELEALKAQGKRKPRPYKREKPYADFVINLEKARALGRGRNISAIQRARDGGLKITKKTVTEIWDHQTDPANPVLLRREVKAHQETRAPEWRAAAWLLEWEARHGGTGDRERIMEAILDHLDPEDLDLIEDGTDPLEIILAKLAQG